jgi:hypothetical protein
LRADVAGEAAMSNINRPSLKHKTNFKTKDGDRWLPFEDDVAASHINKASILDRLLVLLMLSSQSGTDDELKEVRRQLFLLLLTRLRTLHKNRPPLSSYYVGQEYVEDRVHINCTIVFSLLYPGEVEPFEFWLHRMRVNVTQVGTRLIVRVFRKISVLLCDDMRLIGVRHQFIVGYVMVIMPKLNQGLLHNRYTRGNLLSRTFAIFEISDLSVIVDGVGVMLNWPRSIALFPPTARLGAKNAALYVQDYMDAIHAFFRNEYDDCVRRVITSAESFMEAQKWSVRQPL